MNFTHDEVETIKNLINDWGFEYGLNIDRDKLLELAAKLGMNDWVKRNKLT